MRKIVLAALAAMAMPLPAAATTYTGTEFVGMDSAIYRITTNGVLGAVTPGDITNFQFIITVHGNTTIVDPSNSAPLFFNSGHFGDDGGALTATHSSLFFNYVSGEQNAGFYSPSGIGRAFIFGATPIGDDPGDTLATDNNTVAIAKTGNLLVATAVPEPASWAMMLGGLGMVGAAMRRRKIAVSVC